MQTKSCLRELEKGLEVSMSKEGCKSGGHRGQGEQGEIDIEREREEEKETEK